MLCGSLHCTARGIRHEKERGTRRGRKKKRRKKKKGPFVKAASGNQD